jgi:hypothetical protein
MAGQVAVLTVEEAARVRATVHDLREDWRRRHATQPFFTLGTASYLDAREGRFAQYQEAARVSNVLLDRHVGWLLERFRRAVEQVVAEPCVYDLRLALPGFHIFLFDPAFRRPPSGAHFDLQYELIDWRAFGRPEISAQLSLTLTLALPASGGGLMVWAVDRRELDAMAPDARLAHTRANRFGTRHPYTAGHLVAHSGYRLHQIAPSPDLQPGDERITLQAHAMPVDGRWLVYW